MILYDLKCENDHQFESWFSDSNECDRLMKKGFLECPKCGSQHIKKALMAPNISTKKSENLSAHNISTEEMLDRFAENVGSEFANEARKIYYGEADGRPIHGTVTGDESAELLDEGIDHFFVTEKKTH